MTNSKVKELFKCNSCGWCGTEDELKRTYQPNPFLATGDVIPQLGCPKCDSDNIFPANPGSFKYSVSLNYELELDSDIVAEDMAEGTSIEQIRQDIKRNGLQSVYVNDFKVDVGNLTGSSL